MKKVFFYPICLVFNLLLLQSLTAQVNGIVSGPMLGQVEYRDAVIWLQTVAGAKAQLLFWKKEGAGNDMGKPVLGKSRTALAVVSPDAVKQGYHIIHFQLNNLEINTVYEYQVYVGSQAGPSGRFQTKDLWQWRKPAPDFSFLTGSCSYMNQPQYDRPGKPYGGDSSIFETMAKESSAFMLWLGDNWYTREVDYFSKQGLWYRANYDRSRPILQAFLKKMPHYAIWDDHDFGPNDIGREYALKEESQKVFSSFWANPSYGENGSGIYTRVSYGDIDIFMLDDRTWRSSDRLPDSVHGAPNPLKKMFGDQQMEWLKNALAGSSATFKIIATGSQVLNPIARYDCFARFPVEYNELISFIGSQKITGVIFLTGDKHHSEVIKVEGLVSYPLYDVTVSPLTAGTHVAGKDELNNPYRLIGIEEKQNFAKISVTGNAKQRKLLVEYFGIKGEKLGEWLVQEKDLQVIKQ